MIRKKAMMKLVSVLTLVLGVAMSTAMAGEIYGTVSDEAAKPLAGAVVVVRSADNKTEVARDTTDAKGAYRVFVKKTGTTKVVLLRDKVEIAGEAVSYPNPVRYNWIVEKSGDKLILRRQQ
jgi:hypothetical protein